MSVKDKDVEIIRNVLSVQHVPVVGTLAWDKLQFLLHSLCDRISSQASRLDKAEEQGKSLACFKDELNLLCQNALTAANADKAAEAEKQANFWSLIESRLKALEANLSPLQAGQMPVLLAVPDRLSILEETTHSLELHVHDMETQVSQLDSDLQELDADFTAKEARDSGLSTQELTEKLKLLEAQAEEFKQLMQQVTKAQTADLEAIQKTQRMLRSDLEAKPLATTEGGNEGLTEMQKRLERKADSDTVDQLLRASSNTKEGMEALANALEELKKGLRRSSRFSVKMDGPILPAGGDIVSEPTDSEIFEARWKKLEEELKEMANKLAAKADRAAIDEMQFKLASGGGGESTGGGGGGDSGLKDLIAKKADRAEMLDLLKNTRGSSAQVESLEDYYKDLKEKLNTLGSSVTALAERSDLAVLLSKRAEQIAHPVASIQGGAHADDEEIQFVVNEHANRIMVYADMLLQMQVVLATKADNTALAALRELVEKGGMGGGAAAGKAAVEAAVEAAEEMRETVKSHEKMLMKLLEDVGVLGKGLLIMSGHDDQYVPASVPASPSPSEVGSPRSDPAPSPPAPASPPPEAPKPAVPAPSPPPPTPEPAPAPPAPPPAPAPASAQPAPAPAPAPAVQAKAPETPAADAAPKSAEASPSRPASPARKGSMSPSASPRKASRLGALSRSGSPQRGSVIRIKNVQEAAKVVEKSKYHETLGVLEDALNSRKIEPKENVAVLKKLVLEVEKMSTELENNLGLLDNLEANKAEKADLQALAKIVKELKAMDNAMLSGKPLLGFKCMSCNHDLEKLNPNRGPHIPTGVMPRSFLSMLSAERIFSQDKREGSPPRTPPRTPPYDRTTEFVKLATVQKSGTTVDITTRIKDRKTISSLGPASPYSHATQPRRITSAGQKSPRSRLPQAS